MNEKEKKEAVRYIFNLICKNTKLLQYTAFYEEATRELYILGNIYMFLLGRESELIYEYND